MVYVTLVTGSPPGITQTFCDRGGARNSCCRPAAGEHCRDLIDCLQGPPAFAGASPTFTGAGPTFAGAGPAPTRGLRDFAGLASLPDYFEQQYARGDGHIEAFNPTEHWDADQLIAQAAGQTP